MEKPNHSNNGTTISSVTSETNNDSGSRRKAYWYQREFEPGSLIGGRSGEDWDIGRSPWFNGGPARKPVSE